MKKFKWEYITNKKKRAAWWRAFRMWQHRSPELAPISIAKQECASCGTAFCGNYCPRCGQAAGVGRFSFQKAFLLFIDVWGMGNRSMFRSMRDLLLRPGYMIRDYISGRQSAYFPPFKMFFVLAAIALIVEHGFDLGVSEKVAQSQEVQVEMVQDESPQQETEDEEKDEPNKEIYLDGVKTAKMMQRLKDKNPAIVALLTLLLFSWPLFFFLRKSPTIPDLRYSEFVVALVYTSNCFSIISIAGNLLNSSIIKLIAFIMVFVTLRQFSGYSKVRLLGYIILTILISGMVFAAVVGLGLWIAYKTVWS